MTQIEGCEEVIDCCGGCGNEEHECSCCDCGSGEVCPKCEDTACSECGCTREECRSEPRERLSREGRFLGHEWCSASGYNTEEDEDCARERERYDD